MSYEPWVGRLEDGTEVLVSVHSTRTPFKVQNGTAVLTIPDAYVEQVDMVEVAFRGGPYPSRTWSPPVLMKKAP